MRPLKRQQRGGTLLGLVIGLVIGLGLALAVAVYVTKVPIPFVNKNQQITPEQEAAEARKNRDWDPNAGLSGRPAQKSAAPAVPATSGAVTNLPPAVSGGPGTAPAAAPQTPAAPATAAAPAKSSAPSADPLGDLARSKASGVDPFRYFVQAGAFRTPEDADSQRAKLSLMGVDAQVTERDQAGRTVYRVRTGPFDRKDDADRMKERLEAGGLEAALVRVQR